MRVNIPKSIGNQGFTLIEIIFALSVAGFLIAGLQGTLLNFLNLSNQATAKMENSSALNLLNIAFSSAKSCSDIFSNIKYDYTAANAQSLPKLSLNGQLLVSVGSKFGGATVKRGEFSKVLFAYDQAVDPNGAIQQPLLTEIEIELSHPNGSSSVHPLSVALNVDPNTKLITGCFSPNPIEVPKIRIVAQWSFWNEVMGAGMNPCPTGWVQTKLVDKDLNDQVGVSSLQEDSWDSSKNAPGQLCLRVENEIGQDVPSYVLEAAWAGVFGGTGWENTGLMDKDAADGHEINEGGGASGGGLEELGVRLFNSSLGTYEKLDAVWARSCLPGYANTLVYDVDSSDADGHYVNEGGGDDGGGGGGGFLCIGVQ